jgi:hypothetical protein
MPCERAGAGLVSCVCIFWTCDWLRDFDFLSSSVCSVTALPSSSRRCFLEEEKQGEPIEEEGEAREDKQGDSRLLKWAQISSVRALKDIPRLWLWRSFFPILTCSRNLLHSPKAFIKPLLLKSAKDLAPVCRCRNLASTAVAYQSNARASVSWILFRLLMSASILTLLSSVAATTMPGPSAWVHSSALSVQPWAVLMPLQAGPGAVLALTCFATPRHAGTGLGGGERRQHCPQSCRPQRVVCLLAHMTRLGLLRRHGHAMKLGQRALTLAPAGSADEDVRRSSTRQQVKMGLPAHLHRSCILASRRTDRFSRMPRMLR